MIVEQKSKKEFSSLTGWQLVVVVGEKVGSTPILAVCDATLPTLLLP
jgi:hypothetical protein